MKCIFLFFLVVLGLFSCRADDGTATRWGEATGGKTASQLGVEMLQSVLAANMNKDAASVINAAIADYCGSKDATAKTAAKAALDQAISTYVHDRVARDAVQNAVNSIAQGKSPDYSGIAKTVLLADANSAIDKMAGLSDAQRQAAKDSVEAVVAKQTSPTQAVKDNLGTVLTSALASVGVKNAQEFGAGVDAYMKDGKISGVVQAGLNAAIDATPGLTAEQRTDAKKAVADVVSGAKTIGDVTREGLAAAVAQTLANSRVALETAERIGQGVYDVMVDPKNTSNLVNGGIDATIDAIPGLTDKQRADAKQAAKDVVAGRSTVGEAAMAVAVEAAGTAVQNALTRNGVSAEASAQIGQGVKDVLTNPSNTGNLVQGGVNAAIDAIPGLTDQQRADAKAAASSVLNGEKTVGDVAREQAGRVVSDALKAAGVKEGTANEIGAGVDAYVKTGKSDQLVLAGINAAIDAIPGLSEQQRADAKAAAAAVMAGERTIGDVAKDAAGRAVAEVLEKSGVSPETAKQIGQGVTDVLNNPQNTANLVNGGIDAAIDAISGLTPEQKAAAKQAAKDLLSGNATLGDIAKQAAGDAIAKALQDAGVSPETAKQIGQGVTDILNNPGDTKNLVQGGLNAAIDAIPGLTDEQRAAARQAVADVMSGAKTLADVTQEAVNQAIADALRKAGIDPEQAAAIATTVIAAVENIVSGNVNWEAVGDAVLEEAKDILFGKDGYLNKWIDESDLPDEVKDLAKAVIAELHGDEGALMAAGREALLELLMEAGLTREQAEKIVGAAGTLAETYLNGGDIEEVIEGIVQECKTIFCSKVAEMIDKQLAKLGEKFPFLKDLFARLGVDGRKIVEFLMNLKIEDVKAAFDALLEMTWEDWKGILTDLWNFAEKWAIDKLCNYIDGKIDEALQKLLKKAMAAISKIKGLENYMALIQVGGTMVTDIVGTEAKGIINSTGAALKSIFEIEKEEKKGDTD